MRRNGRFVLAGRLLATALTASVATAALAGGPLFVFDPENRIPYHWVMSRWENGRVPVYTDLGKLGVVTNARANEMVAFAAGQWSNIRTSSFKTFVAGDFSALGLGDIDANSVTSVLGEWNGGGMHVVYDNDGSIMENFFGLPSRGVLGITNVEYIEADTPEILEAWMVLSGPGIRVNDPQGVGYQGVVTHELGHAIGLAHSQANGAAWNFQVNDLPQPKGCPAPWSWQQEAGPIPEQVETMYPISSPVPGDTGQYMGTVDRIDDRSAISDMYPAPGYPGNMGTIRGKILDASGNEVTGVNVIARNVVDPFNDFSSYVAGQVSKGLAGPDGSFELNNLTPGAHYVIYTDNLLIGAFSVPRLVVLPGPEEYFNAGMESGDSALDNACAWSSMLVRSHAPVTADITFNKYPGAPTLIVAPFNGYPSDITADGSVVVGGLTNLSGGPIFRWDVNAGTAENIGGYRIGTPSISDDGTKIASTTIDETDGVVRPAIYQDGAWTTLPPVPGSSTCTQDGPPTAGSGWDISGDGSTVVGMTYLDSCYRGGIRAFKWTATGGSVALPKFSSFNMLSRANGVNYDGSVIVGHDETTAGLWRGVFWKDGVVKMITRLGQNVSPAVDVSRDGEYAVGQSGLASSRQAWRHSTTTNTLELLGGFGGFDNAVTNAINDDYSVITGFTTSSSTGFFAPTIWTAGLHWSNFYTFMAAQGVNIQDIGLYGAAAMSGDGRAIAGNIASVLGDVGFVLKTPTSIVCHAPVDSPTQTQTTIVSFPHGLDAALGGGDTLGPCECNTTAPTEIPALTADKTAAGIARLDWSAIGTATGYDLVRGSLNLLRSSHGDFWPGTTDCLENDLTGTSRDDADMPAAGDGYWYLVRAANCGGSATFDSGAPWQVGSRDAGIQASPSSCP